MCFELKINAKSAVKRKQTFPQTFVVEKFRATNGFVAYVWE
jgi:hypothetical protein